MIQVYWANDKLATRTVVDSSMTHTQRIKAGRRRRPRFHDGVFVQDVRVVNYDRGTQRVWAVLQGEHRATLPPWEDDEATLFRFDQTSPSGFRLETGEVFYGADFAQLTVTENGGYEAWAWGNLLTSDPVPR